MRISIACCTYNGEKYLLEQLESLENQTLAPFEIVILDDCSTDNSFSILEKFKKNSKLNVRLFKNEKNLGVAKSFEKALSICEGDYFSFCDQDDVWFKDKLETFSKKMRDSEEKYGKETPLLIYSDLQVVDKNLNLIHHSGNQLTHKNQIEGSPLNPVIVENLVSGCASMFNKKLKEIALPFGQNVWFHDWWLALVACANGVIVPIKSPTIFYRQHGNNCIGMKKMSSFLDLKNKFNLKKSNSILSKSLSQSKDILGRLPSSSNLAKVIEELERGGSRAVIIAIRNNIFPKYLVYRIKFIFTLLFRPKWKKTMV
jgi:glycosyltransferase involved in cell wall biosynthesis